jgi:hypothetical protein
MNDSGVDNHYEQTRAILRGPAIIEANTLLWGLV